MRQVVQILPKRVGVPRAIWRCIRDYAGDFEAAEQEVTSTAGAERSGHRSRWPSPNWDRASCRRRRNYEQARERSTAGRILGGVRLGDLALYEGSLLGCCADCSSRAPPRTWQRRTPTRPPGSSPRWPTRISCEARRARRSRLPTRRWRNSKSVQIRFLAARIFAEAGAMTKRDRWRPALPPSSSRAAGLRKNHRRRDRAEERRPAPGDQDSDRGQRPSGYLVRPLLSRSRVSGAGAFPQADSEFDRCIKRRGEALSLLVDEEPTYGYFPPCTTTRAASGKA